MWQRLTDWLALTTTERNVILFLAGALVLGMGIKLARQETRSAPEFDYATQDSTFAALSNALKSDTLNSSTTTPGKLNINTATDVELETLPGIGPVIAERIIQRRLTKGAFTTIEDLLEIKGMTKKRLEQIKDFITIDRPQFSPSEE